MARVLETQSLLFHGKVSEAQSCWMGLSQLGHQLLAKLAWVAERTSSVPISPLAGVTILGLVNSFDWNEYSLGAGSDLGLAAWFLSTSVSSSVHFGNNDTYPRMFPRCTWDCAVFGQGKHALCQESEWYYKVTSSEVLSMCVCMCVYVRLILFLPSFPFPPYALPCLPFSLSASVCSFILFVIKKKENFKQTFVSAEVKQIPTSSGVESSRGQSEFV